MTIDPEILAQSYSYFVMEAPELLGVLEQELLSLEEGENNIQRVHNMMRATHTLKGIAATVGLETIKRVAHSLEDIFRALCKPDIVLSAETKALVFEGYECLRAPLTAQLNGSQVNDVEILERTAQIFAALQEKLGDCFDQDTALPSSEDLGVDITKELFEVEVQQILEDVTIALTTLPAKEFYTKLLAETESLQGIAESTELIGFAEIAAITIKALLLHPEEALRIGQLALADFHQGRVAVLGGDRSQGGYPCLELQELAGVVTDPFPQALPTIETNEVEKTVNTVELLTLQSLPNQVEVYEVEAKVVSEEIEDSPNIANQEGQTKQPSAANLIEAVWGDDIQPPPEVVPAGISKIVASPFLDSIESLEELTQHIPNISNIADKTDNTDNTEEIQNTPTQTPQEDSLIEAVWCDIVTSSEQPQPENSLPNSVADVDNQDITTNNTQQTATAETLAETTWHKNITPPSPISVSPPPSPPSPPSSSPPQTVMVRVNVEHLEQLNYLNAELLTNQNRQSLQNEKIRMVTRKLLNRLRQFQQMLGNFQEWSDYLTLASLRQKEGLPTNSVTSTLGFDALELDRYSEFQVFVQSVLEEALQLESDSDSLDQLNRQATQVVDKQHKLLTNSRDVLLSARMLPLGEVFNRFYPVLQQLQTLHKKPIKLTLHGTEVLVDKAVADRLYDPLLHLVRNAFDHGIESTEARIAQGKSPEGKINIRAYYRGSQLIIEVRDDGRGINFDGIRQKAISRQLITQENANTFNDSQLTELLFEPGFSTTNQVNDLSGRGVGLDVVRTQLQSIQGSVSIQTEAQKGTTFSLQIPLSLTMEKLLVCQAGVGVYAIAVDEIEQILLPKPGQIHYSEYGRVLHLSSSGLDRDYKEGELVPIYRLSEVLEYNTILPQFYQSNCQSSQVAAKSFLPLLLLVFENQLIALEVDQIVGEQELVIRPFSKMINIPDYVYGASILADGRPTLVLNGLSLLQSALANNIDVVEAETVPYNTSSQHRLLPASSVNAKQANSNHNNARLLLVVDDSITLRQTLALTLQRAGYQVLQARNGEEALEQLRLHPNIELILCDIEMPQMNGFEFLSVRRHEVGISQVPVVMLTSRTAEKHRRLAIQLGANAYLTKPYQDRELLAIVSEILLKSRLEIVHS